MAKDLFSIAIISFISIISISFGVYALSRFISAYNKGEDISKASKHLIYAFFMIIVIPFFIIGIGLKISPVSNPLIEMRYNIESYDDKISVNQDNINMENNIYFNIVNNYEYVENFDFELLCIDTESKCEKAYEILLESNKIEVKPKMSLNIPLTIKISNNTPKNDYLFQINVKIKNNTIYDNSKIKIIIK